MLKKITIFILFIFILLTIIYSFFYASFNLGVEYLKPINDNFRPYTIKNFTLRRVFGLNQPGDAKSDYYSTKQFTKLKVEVYRSSHGDMFETSLELIKNGIDGVINKSEGISIKQMELENVPQEVDDDFIDNLANNIPKYSNNSAVMKIYLLSTYEPHPTLTGLTAGAYGFVIFKNSIEESSESISIKNGLEKNTILHEVGHLLGAKHIEKDGCVMDKIVDVPGKGRINLIPTTYCFYDLQAIKDANI